MAVMDEFPDIFKRDVCMLVGEQPYCHSARSRGGKFEAAKAVNSRAHDSSRHAPAATKRKNSREGGT